MKKRNKVLITGALGHIGAHLIRNLDDNLVDELILLDNLESRHFPSLYNLPKKNYKCKFIQEDITTADFHKYLEGASAVIHLAAVTDAELSRKMPDRVKKINYDGLKRVADACLKSGSKLFFPSTTSFYASRSEIVDETCKRLRPQSPYAQTKLDAERYLSKLKLKGLRYVVCRFGTIFGHSMGMRYNTAVNRFISQAVTGSPLTIWKTAWKQKRPYLHLADCVGAINFILKKDLFDGEIYNVLTNNFTVEEVVSKIKKFVPEITIQYIDSPIMNDLSFEVDDSKFRKMGFRPRGNFQRGIKEELTYLKSISNAKK